MCIRDRAYTVRETLEEVIELTGYVKELEAEKTEEAQARIENIDELISKTESFQEAMEEAGQPATLSAFLEEIALVADIDSVDPDQDYVCLLYTSGYRFMKRIRIVNIRFLQKIQE